MNIRGNGKQPLEIINGQLLINDLLLGSIDETTLHTKFQAADGRSQEYKMQIALNSEGKPIINYFDLVEWVRGYTTSVTGQLTHQSP